MFVKRILEAVSAASLVISAFSQNLLGSNFGIPGDNVTYDYIVVGGGNAGLTIASRLIEQKVGTVAVIEAGSFYEINNGNLSQVPATDGAFSGKGRDDWQPLIDWGYFTTPQPGFLNQSIHYARGKTFGGCSARNYMVHHRGTKGMHRQWADQLGDDSFEWNKFLPWYEKSVNFTAPDMNLRFANSTPNYDRAVVGNGKGPVSLTWSHYAQAFGTWAVEGLKQIDLPVIQGMLSGKLIGQSYVNFNLNAEKMTRESSETSFLQSTLGNPQYFLHPQTMAKRITFDGRKKATGVIVETEGLEYVLSARKEIVLTAGVIGSPQLLMVSGVGPGDTLQSLDIPVVAARPGVGQNMQDHLFFGISYRVNAPTISALQDPKFAAEQQRLYVEEAAGMYTSPVTDVLGFEKIPQRLRASWSNSTLGKLNAVPDDWPEVEYLAISSFLGPQVDSRHSDPNDGFNYATMAVAVVAPQSRGDLTITSANTHDAPLINPGYLTSQADVDVAIAGFKRVREFYATKAMQSFVIGDEYFPGANVTTDKQIEQFIRGQSNTIWHAVSTCTMGKVDDPKAVVDTKGRVIGVKGLRVADAAAFPSINPGHPMAIVYALAEKIACDIAGNCY
ncbi:putative gmc oxidoreductase protein [Seiridium unicorne]|uniref:Gmc oxidoreductase protein n=1 Tax=Seiridium unicorne TaxID=138068 RepID=A0ABR2V6C2_9PEZI